MAAAASYRRLGSALLAERAGGALGIIRKCTLCPHACGVDRTAGETGFCRTGDRALVSSWGPHFGEEAPLVGRFGSGTIFFSNCNLACSFCQNWTISHQGEGSEITSGELANVML